MDKHAKITIISIAIIIATVGFSLINAFSLQSLEYRWSSGSFDYVTFLAGGNMEFCNPGILPLEFSEFKVKPYYKEMILGSYSIKPTFVTSGESKIVPGVSTSESAAGEMILMYIDTELSGNDIARIDSNQMFVEVDFQTKILGIIPFTVSNSYSGQEFSDIMNDQADRFSC